MRRSAPGKSTWWPLRPPTGPGRRGGPPGPRGRPPDQRSFGRRPRRPAGGAGPRPDGQPRPGGHPSPEGGRPPDPGGH